MDKYPEKVIQQRLASICLGMGWNSVQRSSMEILTDLQTRFIREMGQRAQSNAELANHCRSSVLDVQFAMDQLRIDISDLELYLKHLKQCDGMLNCKAVPKFPAKSESNLNFLKPGSREVLVRKVHIQDYFPPMHAEMEDDDHNASIKSSGPGETPEATGLNESLGEDSVLKESSLNSSIDHSHFNSVGGEDTPVREIASFMMTSSGFISPAIQGRTAEARFDRSDLEEGRMALLEAAKLASTSMTPSTMGEESNLRAVEKKVAKRGAKPKRATSESSQTKKKGSKSAKVDPDFEPFIEEPQEEYTFETPAKNSRKRKATKTPQIIEDDDDFDLEEEEEAVPTLPVTKTPPTAKKRGRPRKTPEKPEKKEKPKETVSPQKEEFVSMETEGIKSPLPIVDDNLKLPPPPPHLLMGASDATDAPDAVKSDKTKKTKLDKASRKKEKERKKEERRKEKQRKKEERKKIKKFKVAKVKVKGKTEILDIPVPSLPTIKIKEPMPEKKSKTDRKSRLQKAEDKISTKISLKGLLPKKKVTEKAGAKRGRKPKVKITLADEPKAPSGGIVTTQTVCHYFDAEGNEIWICPVCGKQEEDMPMVGCDGKGLDGKGCDDWYHFVCVGIEQMPETEDWFCPKCAPLT